LQQTTTYQIHSMCYKTLYNRILVTWEKQGKYDDRPKEVCVFILNWSHKTQYWRTFQCCVMILNIFVI